MEQLLSDRSCGSCRGCCKPFVVPEVGKYDAMWCPKSTPCNGCSIYATRPEACKKFACIWLNGLGEESDRPDILGVVMDVEDFHLGVREVAILHLWEIEAGAMNKPRIQQIAEANKNEGNNIVFYHYMLGENDYLNCVLVSMNHFTEEEILVFEETYHQNNDAK